MIALRLQRFRNEDFGSDFGISAKISHRVSKRVRGIADFKIAQDLRISLEISLEVYEIVLSMIALSCGPLGRTVNLEYQWLKKKQETIIGCVG